MTVSHTHFLAAVTGVSDRVQTILPTDLGLPAGHPLTVSDAVPLSAVWYRADLALHERWLDCRARAASLSSGAFREYVRRGWVALPAQIPRLTITHAPGE